MEGISLGFPALLSTKTNKFTFINKQNFLDYYDKNFSSEIEIQKDSNDITKDIVSIKSGDIDALQLIDTTKEHMLFSNHINNFIHIIENL